MTEMTLHAETKSQIGDRTIPGGAQIFQRIYTRLGMSGAAATFCR